MKKSQINQAIKPLKREKPDILDKCMSPYIRYGNETMTGFLDRLEKYYMHCYNSVQEVENHYNYAKEK